MNIGIDVDGVILDSERVMDFYAEYTAFRYGKERLQEDTLELEDSYDLTQEQIDYFYDNFFDEITKTCPFLPGVKEILTMLKADGHKLFIVSTRGFYNERELIFAKQRLKELDIEFDGYEWGHNNKLDACKKLGIDVMIEDNPKKVEQMTSGNFKILYLKERMLREVNHPNVIEVKNWMRIYKVIKKLSENK